MQPNPRHSNRRPKTSAVLLAVLSALGHSNLMAGEVRVARYSMRSTSPTTAQRDLLEVVVTIRTPERIHSVGEAVHYLLHRSGYALAARHALDPETKTLLALPLPAVQRDLGPVALRDALRILAGPAFRLIEDPVHRLIAFERCVPAGAPPPMPIVREAKEVLQHGN